MLSPAQRQGRRAEDRAARYLEQNGLAIVGHNLRCRAGEIDLVALDRGILVFIEVRARQSHQYGGAAASVNRAKQQRLIRAALYFMPGLVQRYFGGIAPPCRFDVVTLGPEGLAWTRLAFDTSERR
jgi:putative endonuclease